MKLVRRSLAALAATLAVGSASAQLDVRITGFTNGYASIDTSLTGVVAVGQMQGLLNGVPFETYCTDLFESVYLNTNYSNYFYAATGSAHGLTGTQAGMIGRLYTLADNGTTANVDSTNESVAFQLAIWEVLYDNAYNVNSGAGTFYAQSGATSAQRNLANSWLATARTMTWSGFDVVRIASIDSPGQNNGRQDLLVVTAVPEPGSYAMIAAGLGVVIFVSRRRRPR